MPRRFASAPALVFLLGLVLAAPGSATPRSPLVLLPRTAAKAGAASRVKPRARQPRTVGANVNVSNDSGIQTAADIAVDPTNPDHLIATGTEESLGYYPIVYESTDGGLTWTATAMTPSNPGNYDLYPNVAFDRLGKAYVAFLDIDGSTGASAALGYTKSGAGSWTPMGALPGATYDLPAIVVDQDTASACKDTLYVAFADSGGSVLVDRSTDGGATFSQATASAGAGGAGMTRLALGPAGKLYVSWLDQNASTMTLASSTDCGATFGTPAVIYTFSGGVQFRVNADPNTQHTPAASLAVDLSTGPHRGRLFAGFSDAIASTGQDIYVFHSDDGGATFSTQVKANDDGASSTADQFLPRLAVDSGDGSVNLVFYDTRDDVAGLKTNVYLARSEDSGTTFLPNVKVSDAQSDETAGAAFDGLGQMMGLAAFAAKLHPLWTDHRGTDEELYTATVLTSLSIGTQRFRTGYPGTVYSDTLVGYSGKPPYQWTVTGLPASLTASSVTGAVSGTPVPGDLGTHTIDVTLKDSVNTTVTRQIPLLIVAPPSVATTSLPDGVTGTAYSATLAGQDGRAPYTWAATGLPASLTLDANTGAITGMPATADLGSHAVGVTLTDSDGKTAAASLTLLVKPPPPRITTTALPAATVGVAYAGQLAGQDGTQPYVWTATGLPASLSLDSASGAISGTPVDADFGGHTVTVTMTDAALLTATASFSIPVSYPPLQISTSGLPAGLVGAAWSATVAGSGGKLPYTWSATGVPAFATFDAGTASFSGTPAAGDVGTHPIVVTLADAVGTQVTKTFDLAVAGILGLDDLTLPGGQEHLAWAGGKLTVQGGTPPFSFGWQTGYVPPAGVNISGTGTLSGTPGTGSAGTHTLKVKVFDSTPGNPQTATHEYALTILGPPVAKPGADQTVDPGPISLDGSTSFDPGSSPLTYTWTPPSGVQLSSASDPKPTATLKKSGPYVFTLTVHTQSGLNSAPAPVTITVNNLPPVADAGKDQSAKVGDAVNLDGSKSSDPNGDTLTFSWKQTAGPTVTLDRGDTATPSFTVKQGGDCTFELTVSDGVSSAKATTKVAIGGGSTPPGTKKGGCGCGTAGASALAMLGLALAKRRRR